MVWEENPEFREKDAFLGGILGGGAAYRPSCEIETEILNGLRREELLARPLLISVSKNRLERSF